MCITLADADAIVAARDRAGRVVQVATMKRYDPAFERMLAAAPRLRRRASLRQRASSTTRSSSPTSGPARSSAAPTCPTPSYGHARRGSRPGGAGRRLVPPRRRPRVLRELPRQHAARPQRRPRPARAYGRASARPGRGRRLVERGSRRHGVGAPRERRPLGQRLDPAPRHATSTRSGSRSSSPTRCGRSRSRRRGCGSTPPSTGAARRAPARTTRPSPPPTRRASRASSCTSTRASPAAARAGRRRSRRDVDIDVLTQMFLGPGRG